MKLKKALEFIKANFGEEYAPKNKRVYKLRKYSGCPRSNKADSTEITPEIAKIFDSSSINYILNLNRFMASQMESRIKIKV